MAAGRPRVVQQQLARDAAAAEPLREIRFRVRPERAQLPVGRQLRAHLDAGWEPRPASDAHEEPHAAQPAGHDAHLR
jgi:hypothetical protein